MEQAPIPPVPAAQIPPQHVTPEVAATSRPEAGPSTTSQSGYSDHGANERQVRPQTGSIGQPALSPESDGHPSQTRLQDDSHADLHHAPAQPPPARSHDGYTRNSRRHRQVPTVGQPGYRDHGAPYQTYYQDPHANLDHGQQSAPNLDEHPQTSHGQNFVTKLFSTCTAARIDSEEEIKKEFINDELRISQRLGPTIYNIKMQRAKFARKALLYRYLINIAIALQVLLGALTTGLAAAVTTVRQGQISTAVLGGLATLVASFLARVRGSGEPELSIIRKKDLDHLLRDARILEMDHGHKTSDPIIDLNGRLQDLRDRLEELLRKANDGGGKQPPVENKNNRPENTANTTGLPGPNVTSAAGRR